MTQPIQPEKENQQLVLELNHITQLKRVNAELLDQISEMRDNLAQVEGYRLYVTNLQEIERLSQQKNAIHAAGYPASSFLPGQKESRLKREEIESNSNDPFIDLYYDLQCQFPNYWVDWKIYYILSVKTSQSLMQRHQRPFKTDKELACFLGLSQRTLSKKLHEQNGEYPPPIKILNELIESQKVSMGNHLYTTAINALVNIANSNIGLPSVQAATTLAKIANAPNLNTQQSKIINNNATVNQSAELKSENNETEKIAMLLTKHLNSETLKEME